MPVVRWTALLLCLAAFSAARAEDDEPEGWDINTGKGPLALRDQYLPSLQHLALTPIDPRPVAHRGWVAGTTVDWIKTFTKKTQFIIDGETVEVVPSVRYGLLEGLEVGLQVPFTWRGGGALDGFINGFHDAFGIASNGRDEVPDNTFAVSINDDARRNFTFDEQGWGLGNVAIESKLSLSQGDERLPALAVQATLSVPTGDQGREFAAGGFDGGLLFTASKGFWGRLYLTADAGFTAFSHDRLGPLALHSVRWFTMGAVEYQFSRAFSLVAQTSIAGPYFDIARLDQVEYFLGIGGKFRLGEHVNAEAGILEHYGDFDVSADFGWHFGIEFGF